MWSNMESHYGHCENVECSYAINFRKNIWEQEEVNSTFMCHALCYVLETQSQVKWIQ